MPAVHLAYSQHGKRSKTGNNAQRRGVQSVIKRSRTPPTQAVTLSPEKVALLEQARAQVQWMRERGLFTAEDYIQYHQGIHHTQLNPQPVVPRRVAVFLLALPAPRQLLALPAPRSLLALPSPGRPRVQRVKNWVLQARHCRTRDCGGIPADISSPAARRFFMQVHWQQLSYELNLQFNNKTTGLKTCNTSMMNKSPLALLDRENATAAIQVQVQAQQLLQVQPLVEEVVDDLEDWVVAEDAEEEEEDAAELLEEIEWLQLPRDEWELLEEEF